MSQRPQGRKQSRYMTGLSPHHPERIQQQENHREERLQQQQHHSWTRASSNRGAESQIKYPSPPSSPRHEVPPPPWQKRDHSPDALGERNGELDDSWTVVKRLLEVGVPLGEGQTTRRGSPNTQRWVDWYHCFFRENLNARR